MEQNAARRRHVVVERVADQRVGETQTSEGAWNRHDEACPDSFVQRVEDSLHIQLGQSLESVDAEFATQH